MIRIDADTTSKPGVVRLSVKGQLDLTAARSFGEAMAWAVRLTSSPSSSSSTNSATSSPSPVLAHRDMNQRTSVLLHKKHSQNSRLRMVLLLPRDTSDKLRETP